MEYVKSSIEHAVSFFSAEEKVMLNARSEKWDSESFLDTKNLLREIGKRRDIFYVLSFKQYTDRISSLNYLFNLFNSARKSLSVTLSDREYTKTCINFIRKNICRITQYIR